MTFVGKKARSKADSVASQNKRHLALGDDTLVFYGDKIFGKPKDMDEAIEMLFFQVNQSKKQLGQVYSTGFYAEATKYVF